MSPLRFSQKTATMLEWDTFLQLYSEYATSAPGHDFLLHTRPAENLGVELSLSKEALLCAQQEQIPSLAGLEDISPLLQKVAIQNHIAEGVELYHIGRVCSLSVQFRFFSQTWKTEFPGMAERVSRIPDLGKLEHEIITKIEPTGEVKENASEELSRVLRQILNLQSRVEHALERYFRDSRYKDALQEDYVTYRHGRAVLLVRAESKNAIRGVVHGESGSGASIFLEPMSVLELNNELAQLMDRQTEEIRKILKDLTQLVRAEADILFFTVRQLVGLDALLARGRFGKAFRCIIPSLTDSFHFTLHQARHPLLERTLQEQGKEIVPVHFELKSHQKALAITGPNTGGKTVVLKTAGLLALMAHCAIPVPAAEGTVFPTLNAVVADIGDQQSIAESLSTFSSHITHIVSILSNLEDRSLVLLDELGTGTDPEEGAPLAIAVLQELLRHEVKVLLTSHHNQMKVFAVNHPECVTAAMEFDEILLQPTYRVLMDQIGASHAFEMAERLGLSQAILEEARGMTDQTQIQLHEFQKRLQERIQELEYRQTRLEQERVEWESKAGEQARQLETLQQKLEQQRRTLKEKNVDLIRTLNARVENLLGAIHDAQTRQQLKKQYRQQVAPVIEELEQSTAGESPAAIASHSTDFNPGDRVWVHLYKDFGEIVSLKKETAELIIRNKRFQVPLSTLEKRETVSQSLPRGIQVQMSEKHVAPELNLIGQTVEEALESADKYLDDAVLSQLPEVRLIHGHGTGRLRKAIGEMLQSHPHVKRFEFERPERGGSAVTIVYLKHL